jgi:hypothetical protein
MIVMCYKFVVFKEIISSQGMKSSHFFNDKGFFNIKLDGNEIKLYENVDFSYHP